LRLKTLLLQRFFARLALLIRRAEKAFSIIAFDLNDVKNNFDLCCDPLLFLIDDDQYAHNVPLLNNQRRVITHVLKTRRI